MKTSRATRDVASRVTEVEGVPEDRATEFRQVRVAKAEREVFDRALARVGREYPALQSALVTRAVMRIGLAMLVADPERAMRAGAPPPDDGTLVFCQVGLTHDEREAVKGVLVACRAKFGGVFRTVVIRAAMRLGFEVVGAAPGNIIEGFGPLDSAVRMRSAEIDAERQETSVGTKSS